MSACEKWMDLTRVGWRRWSFEDWVKGEREAFNAGMTRAAEVCRERADANRKRTDMTGHNAGKWMSCGLQEGAYAIEAERDGKGKRG